MDKFFESYFYEDDFFITDALLAKKIFRVKPNLFKCYSYLAVELDALNFLRTAFMLKYKLAISYHPHYQLYKNINDPSRSVKKSKDKFLKSTLSFSVSSKSKALLVNLENEDFVYIPRSLENKKIHTQTLESFNKQVSSPIFHTKKPIRDELTPIIEKLKLLNQKLEIFEEKKIPFTLLENEMSWSRCFS